jgi:hypothetical protein
LENIEEGETSGERGWGNMRNTCGNKSGKKWERSEERSEERREEEEVGNKSMKQVRKKCKQVRNEMGNKAG